MKTKRVHISEFSVNRQFMQIDGDGFVEFHDSPRYILASREKLQSWYTKGSTLVSNAAAAELSYRNDSKTLRFLQ